MDFSKLKDRNILVTGATGFTGSVLIRKLLEAGANVSAIRRNTSKFSQELPVKWIVGDVYDPATIDTAVENIEYVFHVAAAFREAKIEDIEYHRVHVESTKMLAERLVGRSDFIRFVHVSTMGVHGHVENPPGNEESPYAPGDQYQITKLEAELWIRDFARQNNFPVTVIRPTGIFGPGDRRLLKVFKMAKAPFYPILGGGQCLYHLIHVEDLADAMMLAAVHENGVGEVFLVGNESAIALEDMVKVIARELQTTPRPIRLPAAPFFCLGALCEVICRPLGIEPPIYRRRVAFFTKDRSFDTSRIRNRLGFRTVFTNETGLCQTARWYRENNWL